MDTFQQHNKKIVLTYINAKKQALTDLLIEIESERYTTVHQIVGAIHQDLEILKGLKNDKLFSCNGCYGDFLELDIGEDGFCESCRYEYNAKQDHKTDAE